MSVSGVAFIATAETEADALERVQIHDARATELFEARSYEDALRELTLAQELVPSTNRLYNMAVCLERLNRLQEAIDHYEQFVDADDVPPEREDSARRRLAWLRAAVASHEVEGSSDSGDDQGYGGDAPTGGGSSGERVSPTSNRRRLRPAAFFAVLGVTLASGVAMAVVGGLALSEHNAFLEMPETRPELNRESPEVVEAQSSGRALTISADVLLGVTATAGLATVILTVFTHWGSENEAVMSFSPVSLRSGLGLSISRRF